MRRREFLTSVVIAAMCWPTAIGAQQPELPVIGFLSGASADSFAHLVAAFHEGLTEAGFVDVEKIPSEKGPPRKVYSLNAQGREYLEEFWTTWSFLTERLEQLREGGR